jgi:hypothetical protein
VCFTNWVSGVHYKQRFNSKADLRDHVTGLTRTQ